MNLVNIIKKIFIKKQVEDKVIDTNIALFDISDIDLPSFKDLNEENKGKILQYQKEINVNKLEEIIKYNQDISKEGERLSNLLIKYLYELNDIIRKDDKTEYELERIKIDTTIKNFKILIIKKMLENLLHNCYLKTLSIEKYKKEYEKKEHRFIEIFSRAARIKRNMEIKSLNEAETRGKITIKTITQQLSAIYNAINNNDVYLDKMKIYNKLLDKIQKDKVRRTNYINKLGYDVDITKQLKCKFTKLSDISSLLKKDLNEETEQQILENFAITEIELERFIANNKDKMVQEYISKINDLNNVNINYINKDSLLKECEYLQAIEEVFKDYIDENYKEEVYKLKFKILTFDINNQTEIYSKFRMYLSRDDYHNELEHYIKIIIDKINGINQGISPVAKYLNRNGNLKKMIKLLNSYFKDQTGKYRYEDILFYREKLALLLAFQSEEQFNKFFKEYKYVINSPEVHDCIILPYCNFEWNNELPLETIYTIYKVDGKQKPKFYDIYKLYNKNVNILGRASNFPDDIYYLPEGIRAIIGGGLSQDRNFITYIQQKSDGKVVVLPSTLKELYIDIFGDIEIKDVKLNKGLEYIGEKVFIRQKLEKITFPKSVKDINENSFNFSCIKEIEFQDFKESQLLYNLLYKDTVQYHKITSNLYIIDYSRDNEKYKEYGMNRILTPNIEKIILCDRDKKTEITYSEIYNAINRSRESIWIYDSKFRYFLSQLIEEKTGINLKEYNDEKILKLKK